MNTSGHFSVKTQLKTVPINTNDVLVEKRNECSSTGRAQSPFELRLLPNQTAGRRLDLQSGIKLLLVNSSASQKSLQYKK